MLPTLMVVWSKALPLTASCLSPLPGEESPGVCEKVSKVLRLGVDFCWVLCCPPPFTTVWKRFSHNL